MNLKLFNIIKGMNESKALTKHISSDCRYEFDGRKCNSKQNGTTISVNVSVKNQ